MDSKNKGISGAELNFLATGELTQEEKTEDEERYKDNKT